jgi:2-keto-4-pentenoate hydratase/2-oxohepta-3-ene-1,7-dioic acid hydratase in catechol pathway
MQRGWLLLLGIGAVVVASALVCALPPRGGNIATFEMEPLRPGVADPETALTFASTMIDGHPHLLLVVGYADGVARGIDLGRDADPFETLRRLGRRELVGIARSGADDAVSYPLATLLPTGQGTRQVASGTNFREHADEVAVERPFNFPKFGPPTPSVTSVHHRPGMLLDYEVEICARFDRDLATQGDFEAATKGFFLCGDFTDRAVLTRLVSADDVASGSGFSDAKSGPDFFPTGPFLVIPADWQAFVMAERMTAAVDGSPRQDARGAGMTLHFGELATMMVDGGTRRDWQYQGQSVPLIEAGVLPQGAALMSGTPAG